MNDSDRDAFSAPKAVPGAPCELPPRGARVHFVGVCGTGMAPLALAMAAAGWRVSGEDRAWPEETARWLKAGGVERSPDDLLADGTAGVVCSSAVKTSHPTLAAAAKAGLPILRRGHALAALIGGRPLIAVAGSHGKTTTTAMLVWALRAADIQADHLLGGLFADERTAPAQWLGDGPVVAEIDESDGTIDAFTPDILVCVNVDWDHCDRYRHESDIERAFEALARRTRTAIFYHGTCERSRRIFNSGAPGVALRTSFGSNGDYGLASTQSWDDARGQTLSLGGRFRQSRARLSATGAFNAQNATAALAVSAWLGADDVSRILEQFPGVRRRQSPLPAPAGMTIVEDYAHHPVEISALLGLLRTRRPQRLVVVFQPHRFSRTAQFKTAFAKALALADRVFLLPVYGAGEASIEGGTSQCVFERIAALSGHPPVCLLADASAAVERIAGESMAGDLLAFVGAGDIDAIARSVSAELVGSSGTISTPRDALMRGLERGLSPETIVRTAEPLGPKTTIRVGGCAELYAEPADTADLQTLLVAARAAGMRVHLLGRGSNVIVPDEGVNGLVVRLQHEHWRRFVALGPGRYWAGAGLRLKELCGLACKGGEAGFEFLEGIPGTVGGALRMNAGAMGGWMFDVVEEVHFLTLEGDLCVRRREDLRVEYRSCADLDGAIAVGAVLRARSREDSVAIRTRIEAYQQSRYASQPREPSAGCIFKNPPGDHAGRIIDQLGLKGMRVGDAEVSFVHANFIVNRGQASGTDVISLVRRVRERVRAERSIDLEPEVLLYGREWREFL
jgi:UDP-N-acetylmuramate--L-alanine ligase/UDP-N-acetylenolpyruvoylglucosamine reductase